MSRVLLLVMLVGCGDNRQLPDAPVPDSPTGVATIQILAINDLHGALEADAPTPGIAALATELAGLRTPDTLVIAAGDLIGASPLTSALFHDEPTIEAVNLLGLDASGIGNHELDEGPDELLRIQNGGCHPVDGCMTGHPYQGATFPYLAANTFVRATGETLFPAFRIREVAGVKIAIVGMTLEDTPGVSVAANVADLEFRDEVETMNALLPEIRAQGANVVILALHAGGVQSSTANQCEDLSPGFASLAAAMDPAVAVIASGHSHTAYVCTDGTRTVAQAGSKGVFITKFTIDIDRATETVIATTGENIPVIAEPDPQMATLVAGYVDLAAPLARRVIGTITTDLTNATTPAGESTLGDTIADSMLAAAGGADLALMNTGGIRAPLLFAKSGAETVDGQVTFGEAFAAQPFANTLTRFETTGAELLAVLDHASLTSPILIAGGSYEWHSLAAESSRVTAADVTIGGVALDPQDTYAIVTNSIVHDRFTGITNATGVGVDLDALVARFTASSPIAPPALVRITKL